MDATEAKHRHEEDQESRGRRGVLCRAEPEDQLAHRPQLRGLQLEPDREQQQHDPDLADCLQLADVPAEERPWRMRSQRDAHHQQRDDRAKFELLRDANGECRCEHHHRRGKHQVADVHRPYR